MRWLTNHNYTLRRAVWRGAGAPGLFPFKEARGRVASRLCLRRLRYLVRCVVLLRALAGGLGLFPFGEARARVANALCCAMFCACLSMCMIGCRTNKEVMQYQRMQDSLSRVHFLDFMMQMSLDDSIQVCNWDTVSGSFQPDKLITRNARLGVSGSTKDTTSQVVKLNSFSQKVSHSNNSCMLSIQPFIIPLCAICVFALLLYLQLKRRKKLNY